MSPGRLRVVVCGTTFGQVYLEALTDPDLPCELVGILATGSARSRACADRCAVPLFTAVDQLPGDVDLACVVVRSGLLGGPGTELAVALMERGVHVLQEHPLHRDELAECLRVARRHGVVHRVNPFYAHLAPVRAFLRAVRTHAAAHPVLYVDAACGFPVAYAMLDLVATISGRVRPWKLRVAAGEGATGGVGFRSVDGELGRVGVTLRVQNQLDPADPDGHLHLLHRITVGSDAGELTLVSTHGPVVWTARPRIPTGVRDPDGVAGYATGADGRAPVSATVLGRHSVPAAEEVFGAVWPEGVGHALREMCADIASGADPASSGQYHLALCELWQDVAALLGPPTRASHLPWEPLDAAGLSELARAVVVDPPVVGAGR